MMTADEAREAAKGLSFEDVWAALLKTDAQIEKMSKRVDKTSAEVAKTSKEVAKLTKNLGGIGNSLGKMTEAMFSAELWKKFGVHGFKFTKGSRIKFSADNQVLAEVDFFMENGDYAMPVEIKTELSVEDVDDHLKRMDKIRKYMNGKKDRRKLVGAVAGAVVPPNVLKYAQRKGFFVLVQTGDSIAIAKMPKGFSPTEW
jgi:predicted transcriptional regulator